MGRSAHIILGIYSVIGLKHSHRGGGGGGGIEDFSRGPVKVGVEDFQNSGGVDEKGGGKFLLVRVDILCNQIIFLQLIPLIKKLDA